MDILSQFNLPKYVKGKSFSEASALIAKKYKDNNDPEAVATLNELQGRLQQAQEFIKAEDLKRTQPAEAAPSSLSATNEQGAGALAPEPATPGNALANAYAEGGELNAEGTANIYEKAGQLFDTSIFGSGKSRKAGNDLTGEEDSKFNPMELLRYAPAAMNIAQLADLKKPDAIGLDRLNTKYNEQLVDEAGLQNTVREGTSNVRDAILSSSGGSGSAARANLLGSQLQGTKALSAAYQSATGENRQEKRIGQEFNAKTDQFNIAQGNKEVDLNLEAQAGYRTNKSKLMAQLGDDFGGIGREELFKSYPEKIGLGYDSSGRAINRATAMGTGTPTADAANSASSSAVTPTGTDVSTKTAEEQYNDILTTGKNPDATPMRGSMELANVRGRGLEAERDRPVDSLASTEALGLSLPERRSAVDIFNTRVRGLEAEDPNVNPGLASTTPSQVVQPERRSLIDKLYPRGKGLEASEVSDPGDLVKNRLKKKEETEIQNTVVPSNSKESNVDSSRAGINSLVSNLDTNLVTADPIGPEIKETNVTEDFVTKINAGGKGATEMKSEINKELVNPTTAPRTIGKIIEADDAVAHNPLNIANKYLGIDENNKEQQDIVKGFLNNAVPGLVDGKGEVTKDTNAWCAAFINDVLTQGGFETLDFGKDNYNLIRAKEYERIGTGVGGIDQAQPGDIVVVKSNTGRGYHVGFYSGNKDGTYNMLGGNQDNKVSVREFSKDSITAVRRIDGVEQMKEATLARINQSKQSGQNNKTR